MWGDEQGRKEAGTDRKATGGSHVGRTIGQGGWTVDAMASCKVGQIHAPRLRPRHRELAWRSDPLLSLSYFVWMV